MPALPCDLTWLDRLPSRCRVLWTSSAMLAAAKWWQSYATTLACGMVPWPPSDSPCVSAFKLCIIPLERIPKNGERHSTGYDDCPPHGVHACCFMHVVCAPVGELRACMHACMHHEHACRACTVVCAEGVLFLALCMQVRCLYHAMYACGGGVCMGMQGRVCMPSKMGRACMVAFSRLTQPCLNRQC